MLFGEALRTLLFPFEWPHVYVPILPASMLQLTDSPVPYIMGFYYDAMTTAHTLLELQFEPQQSMSGSSIGSHASICFVDIDRQQVDVPEDLPELPFSENLAADLERELARLESDLSSLAAAGDDVRTLLRRLEARAVAGRLRSHHPSGPLASASDADSVRGGTIAGSSRSGSAASLASFEYDNLSLGPTRSSRVGPPRPTSTIEECETELVAESTYSFSGAVGDSDSLRPPSILVGSSTGAAAGDGSCPEAAASGQPQRSNRSSNMNVLPEDENDADAAAAVALAPNEPVGAHAHAAARPVLPSPAGGRSARSNKSGLDSGLPSEHTSRTSLASLSAPHAHGLLSSRDTAAELPASASANAATGNLMTTAGLILNF